MVKPRAANLWTGLAALALGCALLLDVGCAGLADVAGRTDAGAPFDGGDGGGVQATDAGTPPPSAPPGEGDLNDSFAAAEDTLSCRDGLDNDDDGLFDCADPFCQQNVPSCCVGQVSELCCTNEPIATVGLSGCEGDLSTCSAATELHFFGAAIPDVRTQPGETEPSLIITEEQADTGFVVDRVLDPRSGEITVTASIAVPTAPSELTRALGLGLVPADGALENLVRVAPSVGLLLSGNRDALIVMADGRPIAERPLGGQSGYIDCEVTLSANGEASVKATAGDTTFVDEALSVAGDRTVRAVVWGRGTNPGEETPGRARGIAVRQLACDMPAALTREAESAMPDPALPPETWAGREIGPASVLRAEDGSTRIAIDIEGNIHLGDGQRDSLAFDVEQTSEFSETSAAWGAGGVAHPALFQGDDGVELWFTGYSDDGEPTIGSVLEVDGRFSEDGARVRLQPSDGEDIVSVDHPHPFRMNGELAVLVREVHEDGAEALAIWALEPALARRAEVTRRDPDDLFAFDRDELGGASLIYAGGTYRVYFAGRRGLPWSIGVAVSDDGDSWYPERAPLLSRTDVGPDSLGVRAPSAIVTEEGVSLFYLGTDGTESRIGVAQSPYPRLTPPG